MIGTRQAYARRIRQYRDDRNQVVSVPNDKCVSPAIANVRVVELHEARVVHKFTCLRAIISAIVALTSLYICHSFFSHGAGLFVAWLLLYAVFYSTFELTMFMIRARPIDFIVDGYLSISVCPVCRSKLDNSDATNDRCIACYKCGSAWNSGRLCRIAAPRGEHWKQRLKRVMWRYLHDGSILDHECVEYPFRYRTEEHSPSFAKRSRLSELDRRISTLGRRYRRVRDLFLTAVVTIPVIGIIAYYRSVVSRQLVVVVAIALLVTTVALSLRLSRKRAVREMLRLRLCPCCQALLDGLPIGENGTTQCLGCRAQWKIDKYSCHVCGYDISSLVCLREVDTCPECGSRWTSYRTRP